MRQDSRLSRLLHVLLHMEERDAPLTSEAISRMIDSNPALVRRIMSGLRQKGYVTSEKGHGGGWTLGRPLSEITLRDVYEALDEPEIFAFGLSNEAPQCLVEQAVNAELDRTFAEAEALLLRRLGEVTLAALAKDFRKRLARRRRGPHKLEKAHAG